VSAAPIIPMNPNHRALACAVFCLVAGCSSASPTAGPITVTTASGALRIVAQPIPNPPTRGTIEVDLDITDAVTGSPQDGLTLTVTPWMPAMDHGTSIVPSVTARGQGLYDVTNIDLFMSGTWDLDLAFSGSLVDHAVVEFSIP